jgi:KDO2-lipid IV(A) lauroyltransferase
VPRKRKHIPWYKAALWYHGIRAGTMVAGIPDISVSLRIARKAGRIFGGLNRKRLQRAIDNLAVAFPDWALEKRHEYALRSYEHMAMLLIEMVYAPRQLTLEGWCDRVQLLHLAPMLRNICGDRPVIFISGHCGNWEICGYSLGMLGFKVHALYRPLDLQALDAWARATREKSGMILVDKFGAMKMLPRLMEEHRPVGFVADQNAGDRGLFVPFFNRLASTYKAIGLLATQYQAIVTVGLARRLGGDLIPGTNLEHPPKGLQYRIESVDAFGPEEYMKQPDPLFYIAARYRRAIEQCVRMAPDQYLWMHRYWKSRPRHERLGKPFPKPLLEKIRQLPWITDNDVEQILEHSRRDAAEIAEANAKKAQKEGVAPSVQTPTAQNPPVAPAVEEDDDDDDGL